MSCINYTTYNNSESDSEEKQCLLKSKKNLQKSTQSPSKIKKKKFRAFGVDLDEPIYEKPMGVIAILFVGELFELVKYLGSSTSSSPSASFSGQSSVPQNSQKKIEYSLLPSQSQVSSSSLRERKKPVVNS